MSQGKNPAKKKVVVSSGKSKSVNKSAASTSNRVKRAAAKSSKKRVVEPLLYNKTNYIIMAAGVGLIALGLLLMTGGQQPADQFDPNVIYGFRQTILAPIVILAGLVLEVYGIFKRSPQA